jgi:outer membrane protein assembly factor BamB
MGPAALVAAVLCLAVPEGRAEVPAAVPTGGDPLFGVAWRRQLVDMTLLEYKPIEPAGPAVDPVTKMVVAAVRDGKVLAFDANGSPLWYYEGRGPYVGPPGFVDDLVVVGGADGKIVALDRARGTVRWKHEYREEMGSQPLAVDDLVYIATLQGTVLALDAKTGKWAWHFRREPAGKFTILGVGRPLVAAGVLYQGFPDGSLVALDAKTGGLKWERRIGRGEYTDLDASVQLGQGRIYAASYGGQVAALDAVTGQPIWEARIPYAYKARLEGDTLYVVTPTTVVALWASDGRERWKAPLEGTPFGEPIVVKGMLVVPNGRGLLLLDGRSGKKLRLFTRGSGATGAPAMLGNRVYVLSNAGELTAADMK